MRSILAAAAIFSAGSATAADLYTEIPAIPEIHAPASHDWSGFYAGVHGGGTWGATNAFAYVVDNGSVVGAPDDVRFNTRGWLAGIQLGWNKQVENVVFGVEGDASWASTTGSVSFYPPGHPLEDPSAIGTHKFNWYASIRGRIGLAADRTLLYGTGGVIFGGYKAQADNVLPGGPNTASASGVATGWTAGAGVEHALNDNWSIKGEYQYAHFNISPQFNTTTGYPADVSLGMDAKVGTHLVKLGLNYRFR